MATKPPVLRGAPFVPYARKGAPWRIMPSPNDNAQFGRGQTARDMMQALDSVRVLMVRNGDPPNDCPMHGTSNGPRVKLQQCCDLTPSDDGEHLCHERPGQHTGTGPSNSSSGAANRRRLTMDGWRASRGRKYS